MEDLKDVVLPVHRIIPFSNVEGQGNRTSIFLQGCNINCLYCHNPEMIEFSNDDTHNISIQSLLDKIKGNMPFIRGITMSGGEATIHSNKLVSLFKEVHKLGLTCYIDTNGYFDIDKKKEMVEHTDKFLFDVKGHGMGLKYLCFDRKNHSGTFKGKCIIDNLDETYDNFENLRYLVRMNKVEEVRLVYLKNFYDAHGVVDKIANIIKDEQDILFKLIRVHIKGSRDPKSLVSCIPTKQEVEELEKYSREKGIKNIFTINM